MFQEKARAYGKVWGYKNPWHVRELTFIIYRETRSPRTVQFMIVVPENLICPQFQK